MNSESLSGRLFAELKERIDEWETLRSAQKGGTEEMQKIQRRIALLKELLEMEGVVLREVTR